MFNLRRTAYQCVALRSPSTVLQHTLRTPLSRAASNTIAYNLRNNLTHNVAAMRALSSTTPLRGIEEFYDTTQVYKLQPTGRAWEASELRIKSFEDLHKLWYVLLKERNQLMTHMHDARSNSRQMPEKDRLKRVKLSMARIKVVIGERDRSVKAIHVEENNEGVKRAEKRKAKFAVYQEALRKRAEKNLLKRGAITTNGFVEKSIRLTSRAEKATHAKRNEAATATPTETTTTSQKEKSVDEKASTAEANVVKKTGEEKN